MKSSFGSVRRQAEDDSAIRDDYFFGAGVERDSGTGEIELRDFPFRIEPDGDTRRRILFREPGSPGPGSR